MRRILFLLVSVCFLSLDLDAQCDIDGFATPPVITCGSCTELSAYGFSEGNLAFGNDFNDGTIGDGWVSTQQATFTNPCGEHPNDSDEIYLWFGDESPDPRQVTTEEIDLTLGGTICFDMRYSVQGDAAPCEGPDLPDEGVYLQYSIDGGNTWVTIDYQDPDGGYDPDLTEWNTYCYPIPAAAQTATTQIRWLQDGSSGAEYDHWGLDNVEIYLNDPNYTITWQHDNYTYPTPGGGVNPTEVCPTETTSYEVIMTDGTNSCSDIVTVVVEDPVFEIFAEEDQTICPGDCAEIDAEAKVIVSPAGTREFCDGTVQSITGAFGLIENSIDIFVSGLNMETIEPGFIESVCVDGVQFGGTDGLESFSFVLECPDGQEVELVAQGDLDGGNLNDVGQQTCFTLDAGQVIDNANNPYNGDYLPTGGNSLDDLAGCTAEGIWTLKVITNANFGTGFFNGWCITFDDPEISYEADFWWDPTDHMTNEATLNPTVCPEVTTTYTLFAEDENNCLIVSENVEIIVDEDCCQLEVDFDVTDASCGESDGEIEVTIVDGSGNYTVSWSDDPTTDLIRTDLASGQYEVTVTDVDGDCDEVLTITIDDSDGPEITSINVSPESCDGAEDGEATIVLDGVPSDYDIVWNVTPEQTGESATGLTEGNYSVTVTDINTGCPATENFSIVSNGPCDCNLTVSLSPTNPDCNLDNGSISVDAQNGSGNYSYQWDHGPTDDFIDGLPAGTYTVVVTDIDEDCSDDATVTISGGSLVVNDIAVTNASCGAGACDGSIVVDATGAEEYSIDGGATWQANGTFDDLCAGDYDLVIVDDTDCEYEETITIGGGGDITVNPPSTSSAGCEGECNGFISISVSGGTPPYTYNWSDGLAGINESQALGVCAGTYSVTIEDNAGCSETVDIEIEEEVIEIESIVETNVSCHGDCDGNITINAPEADQFSIDGGVNFVGTNSFDNLCAGDYDVVVANDDGSCTSSQQVVITEPTPLEVSTQDENICPGQDVTITVNVSGGSQPYTYVWDNGLGTGQSHTVSPETATTYNVGVQDANGCQASGQLEVEVSDPLNILVVGPAEPVCPNTDVPLSVFFTSGSGSVSWTSDDGSGWSSNLQSPIINPTQSPTTYTVEATDDCGQSMSESVVVELYDLPVVSFEADQDLGCEMLEVNFTNNTNPNEIGPSCLWDFGDGNTSFSCENATHVYETPGCYDVTLTVYSNEGCASFETVMDMVCVQEGPNAQFDFNPKVPDYENPTTYFTNQSTNANSYVWTFDVFGGSELINPQFVFPQDSTASYEVCLEASSNLGCVDTICKTVLVQAELFVYVPNAFTPDGDGFNDEFLVVGNDLTSYQFEFLIFNRWGNLIFESNDPFRGWDGRHNGRLAQEGVYVWKLRLRKRSGSDTFEYVGHVTLLR